MEIKFPEIPRTDLAVTNCDFQGFGLVRMPAWSWKAMSASELMEGKTYDWSKWASGKRTYKDMTFKAYQMELKRGAVATKSLPQTIWTDR